MTGYQKRIRLLSLLLLLAASVFLSFSFSVSWNSWEPPDNKEAFAADNIQELKDFYICGLEGIIEPSIANHIQQCLDQARDSGYGLIILMDTPGGLETSMRDIITKPRFLNV